MHYYDVLNEGIVFRERVPDSDGRRTIVAVNPTKREWDACFPHGAAGIMCINGKIAIGDGPCLAHDVILDHAQIDISQEKYRLQIGREQAFAEIWCFNDNWGKTPPEDEVRTFVLKRYGETLEQIEMQMEKALMPFMGKVKVKAIPLDEDQEALLPGDAEFIQNTFNN